MAAALHSSSVTSSRWCWRSSGTWQVSTAAWGAKAHEALGVAALSRRARAREDDERRLVEAHEADGEAAHEPRYEHERGYDAHIGPPGRSANCDDLRLAVLVLNEHAALKALNHTHVRCVVAHKGRGVGRRLDRRE